MREEAPWMLSRQGRSSRPSAESRDCRGCDPTYRATEADIDRVLAAPMFRSAEHVVPDDVYEARLALCGDCPKLSGGATCVVCGCYVRVAAKLKARSCPMPGGARWEMHVSR